MSTKRSPRLPLIRSWVQGVTVASGSLKPTGEGSNPSGPTVGKTEVETQKHWSSSWPGYRLRNAVTWVRIPPGALRFVGQNVGNDDRLIFDNLKLIKRP